MVEVELDGQTYRFDSASGADLGPYSDPQGQFVQDCIRVDHPQLPLSVFIRPDRGSDRLEVVFESGRLWGGAGEPRPLNKYRARIFRGSTSLASVDVPPHYWFARWRWQSKPRPIRANPAQLMDQWLVPRLSEQLRPRSDTFRPIEIFAPMGVANLLPYMPSSGERPEIGLLTEYQAQYLCNGNDTALNILLAQAEAAGTFPWIMRDEKTNGPLDTLAYPRVTTYQQGGDPFIRTINQAVTADAAHQPALTYVPYLLTGDPYYLEQLQFQASFNVVWRPWAARYRTTQIRGEAWSLRTWAQAARITPAQVPKWLLPQSHWQKLLDSYLAAYLKNFVANPEAPYAIFRTTEQGFGDNRGGLLAGTYGYPWQDEMLTAVIGWTVLMGHSSWRPVFEWKIGSTIARTNGQTGWLRADCTTYNIVLRTSPDAPWVKSWKEAWDLTAAAFKLTVSDPDRLDLSQIYYFPYTYGALVLAKHLEIPGAGPCLDWANGELSRAVANKHPLPFKWALV
ncbi:MAG TPA: hypothetical protein VFI23_15095 [Rhizomicrobium sp.]|nr:hypothetical protein [Rhizomicrobium sp.]